MHNISKDNQNKPKRLGRGLGSIFSDSATSSVGFSGDVSSVALGSISNEDGVGSPNSQQEHGVEAPSETSGAVDLQESRVWKVAIEKLKPSPFQPRTHFEKEHLEELAQSIRSSGILQPIVVRKTGAAGFEIVAGERRWRAAQIAGLHEVPVLVNQLTDRETLEIALIENLQRQDLNPIEEAEAFQKLSNEFDLTQQQIAEKVGKERASVANSMRLLQLPLEIRELVGRGEVSVGHGKVLLSLSNSEDQLKWALRVVKESIPVRQLEKYLKKAEVAAAARGPDQEGGPGDLTESKSAETRGICDELQKVLGTKVTIDYHQGKGRLTVHFYSDDQLNHVIDLLRRQESHV